MIEKLEKQHEEAIKFIVENGFRLLSVEEAKNHYWTENELLAEVEYICNEKILYARGYVQKFAQIIRIYQNQFAKTP